MWGLLPRPPTPGFLWRLSWWFSFPCPGSQVNTVVSGALDRLHYEKDPCVKYDIGRKLWIYLHRDRSEEEFGMCSASPGRPDVLSRPHPSPPWHSLRLLHAHGREHTQCEQRGRDGSASLPPSHEVTHHLGRGLGLLLEGFPGFGCSCLGLVDSLCGQEWAAELRKEGGLAESQGSVPLHSGV